jgi:hypothetical protein
MTTRRVQYVEVDNLRAGDVLVGTAGLRPLVEKVTTGQQYVFVLLDDSRQTGAPSSWSSFRHGDVVKVMRAL